MLLILSMAVVFAPSVARADEAEAKAIRKAQAALDVSITDYQDEDAPGKPVG